MGKPHRKRGTMTISYRRTFQGAWELYASDNNGYLVSRQYFFYTKREATQLFRAEMKKINNG
jgi:hypothetical protein